MPATGTDIVILTALGVETAAVKAQSSLKWKDEVIARGDLPFWSARLKNGLTVALVQLPNMGPVSAAVTTTRAIEALQPKRVILTGIAAGIGSEVCLGDILVSDQVIDYDIGKVKADGLTHRWRGYPVDPALLSMVRERAEGFVLQVPDDLKARVPQHPDSLKVHIGTILSGSKVIADGRTAASLAESWSQAVGLEMEGGGGAAAAHNSKPSPGFIIIKAVADKADAAKGDQYRAYAAYVAAAFAIAILESGPVATSAGGLGDVPPPPQPWEPVDEEALVGFSLLDIKLMLKAGFNLAELRDLCSDIGVDWEDLADRDQKSLVIDQIVLTCRRHVKLKTLVARVRELRPGLFE